MSIKEWICTVVEQSIFLLLKWIARPTISSPLWPLFRHSRMVDLRRRSCDMESRQVIDCGPSEYQQYSTSTSVLSPRNSFHQLPFEFDIKTNKQQQNPPTKYSTFHIGSCPSLTC